MLDPALIGTWATANAAALTEITATGEMFAIDQPQPYLLGSGGMTLTFPNTNPVWVSNRLSGVPEEIYGLWERYETDADGTWREEWNLRRDGSYTYHWSLDGAFDSEGIGTFAHDSTNITTRERRAQIITGPADRMVISVYFGPLLEATYTVAADGQSWTRTLNGSTTVFTKQP